MLESDSVAVDRVGGVRARVALQDVHLEPPHNFPRLIVALGSQQPIEFVRINIVACCPFVLSCRRQGMVGKV